MNTLTSIAKAGTVVLSLVLAQAVAAETATGEGAMTLAMNTQGAPAWEAPVVKTPEPALELPVSATPTISAEDLAEKLNKKLEEQLARRLVTPAS